MFLFLGMVETEFSIIRFRGDAAAASQVYEGLQPCMYSPVCILAHYNHIFPVTAGDIAEEIVWAAARPPHVNIAEVLVFPVNQATATLNYRSPKL